MDRTTERHYFGDLGVENFFDVNDQVRVFIPGQATGFMKRTDVTALRDHFNQLLETDSSEDVVEIARPGWVSYTEEINS